MKKNVIMVVVDAMANFYLKNLELCDGAAPFLTKLKKSAFVADNVYSQGPYTEAAITPMYTGRDTLDYGGNFFRGDECRQNVFEYFEQNGYDVFNYFQPEIYPTPMERGCGSGRYGYLFHPETMWECRLKYFAELGFDNLTCYDLARIEKLVGTNLDFAIRYYQDIGRDDPKTVFYKKYSKNFNSGASLEKMCAQRQQYLGDKKGYIKALLQEGLSHPLFQIQSARFDKKCKNPSTFDTVYKEFKPLFRRADRLNRRLNRKNNRYGFFRCARDCVKALFSSSRKAKIIESLRTYSNYRQASDLKGSFNALKKERDNFKNDPSVGEFFKDFLSWLDGRPDPNKPYFAMIHVSSLHHPEVFYSLDVDDMAQVREERAVTSAYLDSVSPSFCGRLLYNMSLRYNDFHFERFFNTLEKRGAFQDTSIFFTADHGSSFRYYPLRAYKVNNMFVENYNIPLIAYGAEVKSGTTSSFYTTKDVMASVCDIAGLPVSTEFSGVSVFDRAAEQGRDNVAISEYLGGGCPDMSRREILFCIRGGHRSVSYAVKATADFESGRLIGVYDTHADKAEQHNLKDKTLDQDTHTLLGLLEKRFLCIQKQYLERKKGVENAT